MMITSPKDNQKTGPNHHPASTKITTPAHFSLKYLVFMAHNEQFSLSSRPCNFEFLIRMRVEKSGGEERNVIVHFRLMCICVWFVVGIENTF